MKWNGQLLVLIHPNLNLHINLDVDEKESIFIDLPDEIWSMILKIFQLKILFFLNLYLSVSIGLVFLIKS